MNREVSRAFLALFIGFCLSGAALILTLPAVFGPHDSHQATLSMVLGGVTAILAVGVILMRPPRHNPTK